MGGKGPRRRLGPEERRLWERVAASARPLRADRARDGRLNDGRTPGDEPRPADPAIGLDGAAGIARPLDAAPSDAGPEPRLLRPSGNRSRGRGGTSLSLALPDAAPVGRPQAGLDRRTADRLRKGARQPDARIDLHGMSAERAHRACMLFLGDAIARGHRVVLVITGKGGRGDRGSSRGRGVLRDSLPGWLRASPLGASVVGIYEAHRKHGGEGAFYVYLKRRR